MQVVTCKARGIRTGAPAHPQGSSVPGWAGGAGAAAAAVELWFRAVSWSCVPVFQSCVLELCVFQGCILELWFRAAF